MPERAAILAQAHAAHDRRDWPTAISEYRRFLAAGGEITDITLGLGDVLVDVGDPEAALEIYARGWSANPEDAGAALRLGRTAQRLGRWRTARKATRGGALIAGFKEQPFAFADGPLAPLISSRGRDLLSREGWVDPPSAAPAPTWEDVDGVGELDLVKADQAPQPGSVRLLAAARWLGDGLSSSEVVALAKLAATMAHDGSVTLLFHRHTAQERPEISVLRTRLRSEGLRARFVAYEGDASPVQLHGWALRMAAAYGADALCARAMPLGAAGAPTALFNSDPMLGFACWGPQSREAQAGSHWRRIPADASPLVWIRDRVLLEAGQLDHHYETLSAALNDLMLRANRMGFSAVGRRTLYPVVVDREPDEVDERLFRLRYPEHRAKLQQASSGVAGEAHRLARALADPRDLALDLTGLRAWHDGTSALSVAIAGALARDPRFDLKLLCTAEAARHHGLDRLSGAIVVDPASRPVAAACFKVGQPFTWEELLFPWSVAPVAGFYMLDAISLDVERLSVEVDLDLLWRLLFEHSELIVHLSRYSRDQMALRFGAAGGRGPVALCSTAVDEYEAAEAEPGDDVLLVGNAYEHKNLLGAVGAIHARSPDRRLTVLGRVLEARRNVTWLDSGGLAHADLQRLYAQARAVVFPSLYEGFGLPILHGLASRRPVLAVDQPVFREIQARTRWGEALHLFPTTAALAAGLDDVCRSGFPTAPRPAREQRWSDAARTIGDAVGEALRGFNAERLARRVAVQVLFSRSS